MSYRQEDIKDLVRQVVTRTLGKSQSAGQTRRTILDGEMVRHMPPGSEQSIAPGTLITPLARQVAMERRITLTTAAVPPSISSSPAPRAAAPGKSLTHSVMKVIAMGADHGGFQLKEQLKAMLEADPAGCRVVDCGTHSTDSVDYPDYAYAVAQLVASGEAACGVIIDGAGIGSCMAANKVPGVRAAMCYDQATAVNSREHNNANILTLGAGLIGPSLAKQIVNTWLTTDFAGGRHARRVDKIDQLDRRFKK